MSDWSQDGRYILFADVGKTTGPDLWLLDLTAKGAKPILYLQTPAQEYRASFSPDGKWVAYTSDEQKHFEVFVQSVPPGQKFQVSTKGGADPVWSADGQELYYSDPEGNLMAVPVKTTPQLALGTPRALFQAEFASRSGRNYSPAPDGKSFAVLTRPEVKDSALPYTVVINWQAGLKQ